ncbi:alpha/beta fold hydrolase [Kiloniella sp. b19]|uniref:alpha/beta fold hydrolase n=1 Tax=Kiloniella sp. GXU_MW_B19 TaxID=3141326 RepID=UPI0031DFEC0B
MDKARERIVFLPGLLCNERLWSHQIEALGDIAVCEVADFTTQENLTDMAHSVLNSVRGRFSLAGLSMGGYVALEVMRLAPERINRLALIDTKARADSETQKRRRRGLLTLANSGKFKGVTPHLMPLLIHESRLNDESITSVIYEMAEEVGREAFLRQQTAILNRESHLDILGNFSCPVTIVTGRQDEITPVDCAEEMHAGIANSSLHLLEHCGHLAPLERPEEVNRLLLEWLSH